MGQGSPDGVSAPGSSRSTEVHADWRVRLGCWGERLGRVDPPLGRQARRGRRAELALRGAAAKAAAEAQPGDWCVRPTIPGEALERRLGPAIAVQAVEPEGVAVGNEVGDGVEIHGVHVCSVVHMWLRG
jgi:hypothetical protein